MTRLKRLCLRGSLPIRDFSEVVRLQRLWRVCKSIVGHAFASWVFEILDKSSLSSTRPIESVLVLEVPFTALIKKLRLGYRRSYPCSCSYSYLYL